MYKFVAFNISILFFSLAPIRSEAIFSNYNSILIGEQAAGMGGAATAMAEDASGAAWYNPASLEHIKGQSLSAAVGIYKKFDTRYGVSEDLTKAALRANEGFFTPLPSSTGNVIRFKEGLPGYTFSFSIIAPEYDNFKGDVNSTATNTSTFSLVDQSLWVGGAVARRITPTSSVGLTVYYIARSMSKSVSDRSNNGTAAKIYNEDRELKQNFIVPILGYFNELTPEWRIGFSARLPVAYQVAGFGSYFDDLYETGQPLQERSEPSLQGKARIPTKFSLGVSWKPLTDWQFASDITYYDAAHYTDFELPTIAEYIDHQPTWNGSLGVEYAFREWFKIRAGGFTNFSSHPRVDPSRARGQADKVDQLGFSANLAYVSGPIQYTFGGYYTGGRGNSVQRINHEYTVISKTQQVFTMLVGTSFSY